MPVADLLVTALAAHRRARQCRQTHDSAGNHSALTTAHAALTQAQTLDPTMTDPAWQTLPCPTDRLQTFYTRQTDQARPLPPSAKRAQPVTRPAERIERPVPVRPARP